MESFVEISQNITMQFFNSKRPMSDLYRPQTRRMYEIDALSAIQLIILADFIVLLNDVTVS